MKRNSKTTLTIVGVVFLGAGILFSITGWNDLQNAKASAAWSKTEGAIISAGVKRKTSFSTGRRGKSTTTYVPEVSYDYTADGKKYTSNRIMFGGFASGSRSYARGLVEKYAEGKKVTVHYNPEKPELAVLEAGVSGSSYIPLLGGLACLGVGVFLTFFGRKVFFKK